MKLDDLRDGSQTVINEAILKGGCIVKYIRILIHWIASSFELSVSQKRLQNENKHKLAASTSTETPSTDQT